MIERPTPGEQVAGIAGLALILTMFLFAWYGVDVQGVPAAAWTPSTPSATGSTSSSSSRPSGAWRWPSSAAASERSPVSLSVVDHGPRRDRHARPADLHHQPTRGPRLRRSRASEVELGRKFGLFLGLIELVALTVGGYMTMQEEGVSFGSAADRLSGPGAHSRRPHQQVPPPPPPAQPPQQPHYDPPPPRSSPTRRRRPSTSRRRSTSRRLHPQQPPPPPPPPPPARARRTSGRRVASVRSRRRPAWRRR